MVTGMFRVVLGNHYHALWLGTCGMFTAHTAWHQPKQQAQYKDVLYRPKHFGVLYSSVVVEVASSRSDWCCRGGRGRTEFTNLAKTSLVKTQAFM